MDELHEVVIATECDPWSACGGEAPVLHKLLSWLEVTLLLHVPVPYRRQCTAPATEQKAVLLQRRFGCSVEDKQQLHRTGNATQNPRLLNRSTATSHKTQTLHSVRDPVCPSRDNFCCRQAPRSHAVKLHSRLHSHCTVSTLLNTVQYCSVLLKPQ